jgi:sugar/nucleoside kinase (ribokinase family)
VTRIVCAGLATRDTIWRVPSHPPEDGRVVASEVQVAGGGPAATAAVAIARLGCSVSFVGAVGDDEAGRFVSDGLAREGVDVSGVAVVPGARTAQSTILVGPSGTRSIVHHPGTAELARATLPAEDAAWIHVDHLGYGLLRAGTTARISVDGGNPIDGLELGGVALYAPTEDALRLQFGDAQGALAAGSDLVVVTRGAEGSSATSSEGVVVAPGVPCDDLVSTLGAGDVFHGALLAYLARGETLEEALRGANTAASLSCRALDGRSAIPTRDELEQYLR